MSERRFFIERIRALFESQGDINVACNKQGGLVYVTWVENFLLKEIEILQTELEILKVRLERIEKEQ